MTASGTGFFDQCFPSATVDLAVSFTAMHWLSRLPGPISTGVHSTQATGEERAAFEAQSAKDFESILLARAAELKPGGRMVVANFAQDPNGHWLGKSDLGPCMYDTMDRCWRDMAEEGRITMDEYRRTTFCNHYRTEREMLAPFAEGTRVHAAGLRLDAHSFVLTRCPYREHYRANGGDALKHARWMITTMRTWSNSTFESALDTSRTEAEKRALSDELFDRMARVCAECPTEFGMDYVHAFLVVSKA